MRQKLQVQLAEGWPQLQQTAAQACFPLVSQERQLYAVPLLLQAWAVLPYLLCLLKQMQTA